MKSEKKLSAWHDLRIALEQEPTRILTSSLKESVIVAAQRAESLEEVLRSVELYFRLGYQLADAGECESSQQLYQKAIDLIEILHTRGVRSEQLSHGGVAHYAFRHAHQLAQRGEKRQALTSLNRCVEALDGAISGCSSTQLIFELCFALSWCASLRIALHDRNGAMKDLGRVAALCRVICLLGIGSESELVARGILVVTYARLARCLRKSGCPAIAAHFQRQSRLLTAVQAEALYGPVLQPKTSKHPRGVLHSVNSNNEHESNSIEEHQTQHRAQLKRSKLAQRRIRRLTLARVGVLQ